MFSTHQLVVLVGALNFGKFGKSSKKTVPAGRRYVIVPFPGESWFWYRNYLLIPEVLIEWIEKHFSVNFWDETSASMLKMVVLSRCVVQLNAVCDMRSLPRHLAVSELALEKIGLSTPKGKAEKTPWNHHFSGAFWSLQNEPTRNGLIPLEGGEWRSPGSFERAQPRQGLRVGYWELPLGS